MARETKVGLLAGLAFIVCFAVILANRGRQLPQAEQPSPTRFQYVQSDQGSPQTRDSAPLRAGSPASAANSRVDRGSNRNTSLPADNAETPPRVPQRNVPPPHDNVDALTDRGRSSNGADDQRFSELERRLDQISRELASQDRDDIRLAAPAGTAGERDTAADNTPPVLDRAASEPSGPTPQKSPPARVQILTRHKVVAGDTLSRIASAHYGSQSKRMIDAIMDANRGVLANPDLLTVGLDLVIPVVDGVLHASPQPDQHPREPKDDAGPGESPDRDSGSVPFRWYQIQKDDRYVSIARKELGDENRWREIFEMNQEAFPDASRIRAGVRIKLPTVAVAASREGRRP